MNLPAFLHLSEGVNESGLAEQRAGTCPIKAQSTAVARATASICNAEWARSGVMSGHVGFVHTFSALRPAALALVASLAAACGHTAQPTPAMEAAQAPIQSLVGDAACDADAQCRTIGIGQKPCGGPAHYVAWSTLRTDAQALQAAVARHAATQRRELMIEGRVSTCEVAPDPGAYCDLREPAAGRHGTCRLLPSQGAGGQPAR